MRSFAQADEAAPQAAASDPDLRSDLLQRFKVDQDARSALMSWCAKQGLIDVEDTEGLSAEQKAGFEKLAAKMKEVDTENTRWLMDVVERHGWPTRKLVGKDGALAAWLLAQHADADPAFQRKCLDLMTMLPRSEVAQENVAFLTDRVLLAEGKKQRYGTQFAAVDGKLQPRPLEDEANVDKLRAQVGLPPLAEYLKEAEMVYIPGAK